ncbi:Arf GTPase activating protein, partial [Metschnikowia bicuspidata var. bicuspidata NRRL YB-4993]
MSALPSSRKTHSEKHKQIFRQLLKESPNKSCVDCKSAQHPRWASWNLGCFICIRCSGIHRSMGTHISRVKSVDLDVWTDEQVESMIKWGNEKCNLFWEARLPAHYVPDPLKIENFIRTKYDMK